MASTATNAVRAGRAFVEVFLDATALERGLEKTRARLKSFGEAISKIGTAIRTAGVGLSALATAASAPLIAATKLWVDAGDRLAHMSERTGIAVESLSALGYAADQSGSNLEDVETGIGRLERLLGEAARGSDEANQALSDIGLTLADLKAQTPDDQFRRLAGAIASISDPALRTAATMAIFGRQGRSLIPLLSEGAGGLKALEAQARSLGLVFDGEDAAAAKRFRNEVSTLWAVIRSGANVIGGTLAPVLSRLVTLMTRGVVDAVAWARENRALVVLYAAGAAAVGALGLALLGLGAAIRVIGTGVAWVGTGFHLAAIAVKAVTAMLALLLTPVGAVTAAVIALGSVVLYASGLMGKALAWVADRFLSLRDDALRAYRGIADALAANDLALAARVLWLALKAEWTRGVAALHGAWLAFKFAFLGVASDAFYGVQAAWEITGGWLMKAWVEITAFSAKVWNNVTSTFREAWEEAIGFVEKRIHELLGLWDSTYDVRGAKAMVDQRVGNDIAGVEARREKENARIDAESRQHRADLEEAHTKNLAKIGQDSIDARSRLDGEYAGQLQTDRDAVAKARDELAEALKDASVGRALSDFFKDVESPDRRPRLSLEGVGETIRRTVGARGTFSAIEATRFGAGGTADRLTRASEETARNTKRLIEMAREGGLTFE